MGGVNETFSLVSPVFAIYRAHIPQIGPGLPGFGWYPLWICAGLFASIFFLGLASWIVPKSWQDREVLFRKKHFILSDFNSFRSQHLNSNPLAWLVNRNASMRQSRIFLILYIAVAWLAITLYSSLVDRVEPSFIFTGMSLLWLGSLWFRIDLTRHTVSSISEAKESGALEQILVTPIDERQFRRGHFRAMASFWAWPLISLMIAPVLYICIQVFMHPEMLDEGGLILGLSTGLTDRFQFGLSYGSPNLIGDDSLKWYPRPEAKLKYLVIDESMSMPALAIGLNTQGLGDYRSEDTLQRYETKALGVYGAFSKNWETLLGNMGFHSGMNYSFLENSDGDEDLNLFFGLDLEFNPEFSLLMEYNSALNENDKTAETMSINSSGYLNAALRWSFVESLHLELHLNNLLFDDEKVDYFKRELKITYIEFF